MYIPIIRIPVINGGRSPIPNIGSLDPGTYTGCIFFMKEVQKTQMYPFQDVTSTTLALGKSKMKMKRRYATSSGGVALEGR